MNKVLFETSEEKSQFWKIILRETISISGFMREITRKAWVLYCLP